jgi:beta-glucanase (GH16 family)
MRVTRGPVPAIVGAVLVCAWAVAAAPQAVGTSATAATSDVVVAASGPGGGAVAGCTAPVAGDGAAGLAPSGADPAVACRQAVTAQAAPVVAADGTAATTFGWGTPLPMSDEFDYAGAPDPTKWKGAGECWPGHSGNGRRCASLSTVADGQLRMTGLANGDSGWLRNRTDQRYGRWEVRMRVVADGLEGDPYHPVLLTWPQSGRDPQGGEYDFSEANVGEPIMHGFIHHPSDTGLVHDRYVTPVDMSQWHTYALEWHPGHIRVYIDGMQWFDDSDPNAQAPEPMHGNIQLDNFFHAGGMQPAHLEVDWYHVYRG